MAKDKTQRFDELIQDEAQMLRDICRHVASGGSLIEWCNIMQVYYADVSFWLRADKERSRMWEECQRDRGEWYKESILLELRRLSMSDIRKIFNEDGSILPAHEWPDDIASVISSIEAVEEFEGAGRDREQVGWNKKVKLWNKEKAIELLGKHIAMFTEHVHHTGQITLEDLVTASRESEDEQ